MLRVKCPNCAKTIKCDQGHAGEQIQCPACEHRVLVPFDAPDLEAIRQRTIDSKQLEESLAEEARPPVVAQLLPAKIDDLLDLHRTQHAELCERFGTLQTTIERMERSTNHIRSHITIIAWLILLAALVGGCGIFRAASASREFGRQQEAFLKAAELDPTSDY